MTEEALSEASQAQTLVLEANFDEEMLENGPYPRDLKDRIRGGHGHLGNTLCAEAVKSVWHPQMRHIYLCHLSENNNTPALAWQAVAAALQELGLSADRDGGFVFSGPDGGAGLSGADGGAGETLTVTMMPLPRRTPSPLFSLWTN